MAKVLEDHHGYLRKVAERSTNFLICYLAPPCLKHCGCWHLLTYLLRFGPMLLGFQDGRRNFPEEVCRCDLVHQGQRSEEDRGATYTNSYTHICIYLHKCIHMFSHISCGQVFLTIYTNKYIYICLLPMYANRFQKINREFGIQTINIYPAGLTHPTKGSRWRCRQCVWHRESLEEPLGAYDWATNQWCSNRFKQLDF